jgi:phosphate transport system substrate-binding protein
LPGTWHDRHRRDLRRSQALTDSFPSHTAPSNFIPASGSGGVQAEIVSLSGAGTAAIAYLSPDWTNTFLAPSSSSASANLSVASLRNTTSGVDVAPTYTNATAALASYAPPTTATTAADQTQWVPNATNPTTGYPVSGTSQMLLSQCYADTNAKTTVLNFLTNHYQTASYASIIHGNGFDTVPSAYSTQIINDFVSVPRGASITTLNIGNTTVCAGIGR